MADTVTIREAPTLGSYVDTTYEHPQVPGTVVYTGRAVIVPIPRRDARIREAGEEPLTFRQFYVGLPNTVTAVRVDHELTVDVSADGYLDGRTLRVTEIQGGTGAPFRRLVAEDEQG